MQTRRSKLAGLGMPALACCLVAATLSFPEFPFRTCAYLNQEEKRPVQEKSSDVNGIPRVTTPKLVGIPIKRRPLCLDYDVWYGEKGKPFLVGCSYLAGAVPYVFYVDAVSGRLLETKAVPAIVNGPYHVSVSQTTNRLYIASVGNKCLFYYDLISRKLHATSIIDSEAVYIFGVVASPWGKVYFGTTRSKEHGYADLYDFDETSGRFSKLMNLPGAVYIKPMVIAGDHQIAFGASGEQKSEVYLYNVETDQLVSLLPAKDTTATWVYNMWGGHDLLVAKLIAPRIFMLYDQDTISHSWHFESYLDGAHSVATGQDHDILESDSLGGKIITCGGHELVCGITTDFVYWHNDIRGMKHHSKQIVIPLTGTLIHNLTSVNDSEIYGGTYETNSLFKVNTNNGNMVDFGPVHPSNSGEINVMVPVNRKLYIFSYTHSEVCVYDPGEPWNVGNMVHPNPLFIGRTGQEQYRPLSAAIGPDHKLYVGSMPDYNRTGGALTVVDPQSDSIREMRYIDDSCSIVSVVSCDGLVLAGSSVYGSNGDRIEFSQPAHLIIYDPQTDESTTIEVEKTAVSIGSLGCAGRDAIGTVELADGQQEIFVYSPERNKINIVDVVRGSKILGFIPAADGQLYGYTDATVFRFDTATGQRLPLITPEVDPDVAKGIGAVTIDPIGEIWFGVKDMLKECSIVGFNRHGNR